VSPGKAQDRHTARQSIRADPSAFVRTNPAVIGNLPRPITRTSLPGTGNAGHRCPIERQMPPCRALLGWTDADGNFYEQKFELRDPDQGPHLDAPRVRLRMRSWISGAFQWLQLGERNVPWLLKRENVKDEDYFDVTK